jgi:hypothetical protein
VVSPLFFIILIAILLLGGVGGYSRHNHW